LELNSTEDAATGAPALVARVRRLAASLYPYHVRYEAARDPRAVFAFVYFNITSDLADRLNSPLHGFEDPEWVVELAIAFAGRFQSAMDGIDGWRAAHPGNNRVDPAVLTASVPGPWIDVYLATRLEKSYVLEDLIFGMCAHITYDLPHALDAVPHSNDRLADYHRMNELLASRTKFIEEAVADRYQHSLHWLDWVAGAYGEFFSNYGMRMARAVAWYNAMRLLAPNSQAVAEDALQRTTQLFIEAVRRPKTWWARILLQLARTLLPSRRRWPVLENERVPASSASPEVRWKPRRR